jgi:hypothetical protein
MKEKTVENVGVINPWALAEVMLGKRIRWKKIADPQSSSRRRWGCPTKNCSIR